MFRSLHIANKIPHFPHSYPPCKLPAQQPFLMQGRLFCIALSVCFMVIFKIFELILNKKRKLC
nr:MAG TPA: hypothetical protein [Caudoviricetes sp.]